LNVSEQQAEQTSGEPGSLNVGPAAPLSSDVPSGPVAASAQDSVQHSANETPAVASPDLVPEQGAAAEADAPKSEAAKPEAPKAESPKVESPKAEAPKADAPHSPGKVLIMSAGDRNWNGNDSVGPEAESAQASSMFGKRRLAALAAVVTLAVLAGALGGALATAGYSHFVVADSATSAGNSALEASVARIDADILVLKASIEHTSKMGMSQFNKTSDRLDKVEKAQAEPAAKLAKLSEAVDKLRVAPPVAAVPVAAAPVAAKEVTGSITPPTTTAPAAAPAAAPKPEVARLPTVEGWVLRDVANGGALIEGRQGLYEVFAGDPIPGLGRVDAIRRQDGRWVVVTSKGLIVAR
jgi:hypothetical protein